MTGGDNNDVTVLVSDATLIDIPPVSQQKLSQGNICERWAAYEAIIQHNTPEWNAQETARREALYYYYEYFVASLMGDLKSGFGVVDQQELANEDARLSDEKWDMQVIEDHSYWDSWDYCNYGAISKWVNKHQTGDPYMPFEFEGIAQNVLRAQLELENGWELYALDHVGLRDIHRLAEVIIAEERNELLDVIEVQDEVLPDA